MSPAKMAAAVSASLVLHGAALAWIDSLPRGWQSGSVFRAAFGAGVLQARMRTAVNPADAISIERQELLPLPVLLKTARRSEAAEKSSRSAAAALALIALPLYLPAAELDEKPLVRTSVEPEYPQGATSEGRVVLRLFINEAGGVDEVAVASAEPAEIFAQPAVKAFASALFTPGRKDGIPVKSSTTVEVLFGAPPPVALYRTPEGPLFQPPRRRPPAPIRKELP
jgi:protein TonB